ncbi:hypothetical protein GCM10008938_52470 [Deinococcus roseus]|uniref:Uncharacterized protein n=1 Tax=Deinococcus roseus TaxID=392414 RepID=A0ABQ2DJ77_9DEIO|nr:hypothetical protein GCM10008938_52470 [Deinococcus roseus]
MEQRNPTLGFTAGHRDLWLSPVFRVYPDSHRVKAVLKRTVKCAGLSEKAGPEMTGPSLIDGCA